MSDRSGRLFVLVLPMIIFLKEKGFAILLLSVIFTFSSFFWTSDVVYNQEDFSNVEFGWPMRFITQDFAFSLTPPKWWFPKEVGFGLPQEYPMSFIFYPFVFDIAINFFIIFSTIFIVLQLHPNARLLRKIISTKYIVGAVVLMFVGLVSFLIFDHLTTPRAGEGIPPPHADAEIPFPIRRLLENREYIVIEPQGMVAVHFCNKDVLADSVVLGGVDLIKVIERVESENNGLLLCDSIVDIKRDSFNITFGLAVRRWRKGETNTYIVALYSKNDKRQLINPFEQSIFIYKFDFNNNQVYVQTQFDGSFRNAGTIINRE